MASTESACDLLRSVSPSASLDLEPLIAPHRSLAGHRVAVAVSGGVDSALALYLLRAAGADVVGLCLRLSDVSEEEGKGERACCAPDDLQDARRVAESLGVPFYVLDAREPFARDVVEPFIDAYLAGRTPNPCVRCNGFVKLGLLDRRARALGAEYLVTGHYARIARDPNGSVRLLRAVDLAKDQSYFLFGTSKDVLRRLYLPLGALDKATVRDAALAAGLPVAHKLESQEVCFVGGAGSAEFVARRAKERGLDAKGAIVDAEDRVLGEHEGFYRYTVGQRRGLGVAGHHRLYVLGVDPVEKTVRLGDDAALQRAGLWAKDVAWIGEPPAAPLEVVAKIRSRDPGTPATVFAEAGRARVAFHRPVRAVAPGQAVVFYAGDAIAGGGWIEEAIA